MGSAKERRTEIQRQRERFSGQIFNELRLLHPPFLKKALNPLTKISMFFPGVIYGCESWTIKKAAAAAKSIQSCPTLCDPTVGSLPGSSIHGILQARHWSGLLFPSPMHESESEVSQWCLALHDPMDFSLPASSIHGIFQARVLEWVAISFSKES